MIEKATINPKRICEVKRDKSLLSTGISSSPPNITKILQRDEATTPTTNTLKSNSNSFLFKGSNPLNKKGSSKSGSFLLKSSKAKAKLEVCNNPNTVNKYTELRIIAILFLKKLRILVFIFPSNNHKTPMQISPSVRSEEHTSELQSR